MQRVWPAWFAVALGACAALEPARLHREQSSRPHAAVGTAQPGGSPETAGNLIGEASAARPAQVPIAASSAPPGDEPADQADDDDSENIDDDVESVEEQGGQALPHPLDGWSPSRIERALSKAPASLGSISVGYPNAGALLNGARVPPGDGWNVVDPSHAYGTSETVESLLRCIELVRSRFPDTPPVSIGHLSGPSGGHLRPHVSHQSGRDVDVGYYYTAGARWYARANAANLDRARTWALLRALVTETDVDLILIDRSIQRLLRDYAKGIGENGAWVDSLFDGCAERRAIVRHARGHATHIHVRFVSPIAQETGRRTYDILVRRGTIKPPTFYVKYVAKKGDTLGALAKKFGTSTKAILQANRLKSNLIRTGAEYRIPSKGGVRPASGPIVVPRRRLPPDTPGGPMSEAAPPTGR